MSRIEKLNGSELKRLEIMGKMKDLAIKIAEENIDSLYRDADAEMLFIKGMDTEQQQRVMHEEQLLENKIDEDRKENR
tara:strand:+ start:270 stop:503 length:234 start_codon:yes stop_codon:yes gene_type:complete